MENSPTWTTRLADVVRDLGSRRWSFFFLLLFLNALLRPYAGFAHDARLYAVQVLNRVTEGDYNEDLFFRYGSQDSFSLFSAVVGPLVAAFGLSPTFFVLYLIFNTLYIYAILRFVQTLIKDPLVSTLAVMYVVMAPANFGGGNIFHVHEPFLTPRIVANTLVLFALTRGLENRWISAFVLVALALTMHPLMAFGGLLILSAFWAMEHLSVRTLIASCAVIGCLGIATLVIPPLGTAVYKYMDPEWRENVRLISPYNFPSNWSLLEWVNVAVSLSFALVGAGLAVRSEPRTARFLYAAAAVSFVGFLGTLLGSFLPYALLFQGQPYRVLWILKLLQAPLGFTFIALLWRTNAQPQRLVALAIVVWFGITNNLAVEYFFLIFLFPFALFVYRALAPEQARQGWLWKSVLASLVFGFTAWAAFKICLLATMQDQLLEEKTDIVGYGRMVIANIGPMAALAMAVVMLGLVARRMSFSGRFAGLALLGCLLIQGGNFGISEFEAYRENFHRDYRNIKFVEQFIKDRSPNRQPTIYCGFGVVQWVWIKLEANCYFEILQMVGTIFNRETGAEGLRRAALVRSFELDRAREQLPFMEDEQKERMEDLFHVDLENLPSPTRADLEALAAERSLDFIVLKHKFDDVYSATNGEVFIYECAKIRSAQASLHGAVRDQRRSFNR